jgi:hypothetical protein
MCKYWPRILGMHSTFVGQHDPKTGREHTTFHLMDTLSALLASFHSYIEGQLRE